MFDNFKRAHEAGLFSKVYDSLLFAVLILIGFILYFTVISPPESAGCRLDRELHELSQVDSMAMLRRANSLTSEELRSMIDCYKNPARH